MRLFIYLLVLVLAVAAGFFLYQNPGDLEIAYQDWVVVMPLWIPVALVAATILFLTIVFSFLSAISRGYRRLRDWLFGSSVHAVLKNANSALIAFEEGDWQHAETGMLKAAKHSEYPLNYYLIAAKAAQELQAIDRRDKHLHTALKMEPDAKVAIGLTQAELQYRQDQYDNCAVTLKELLKQAPHNTRLLKLLALVHEKREDWPELAKLLPQLKKYMAVSQVEYDRLEAVAYSNLLGDEAKNANLERLIEYWDSLPKQVRQNHSIIYQYVCMLLLQGGSVEAENILRSSIKRELDEKLVMLYGLCIGDDITKQISTAESWLTSHKNDPALLLCLARLCIANKLWGKARAYLDASLGIEPNPDAFAELGRLLGILGEQQKSLDCYRNGLMQFATVLEVDTVRK